jgi:PAS domain S-box-containing protein
MANPATSRSGFLQLIRWKRSLPLVAGLLTLIAAGWWVNEKLHNPARATQPFRIGFHSAPPNQNVTADGKPSGSAIEIIVEACRRRKIPLEWVFCPDGPDSSLIAGKVDLWPLITDLPERRKRFYISEPWTTNSFWMVTLKSSGIASPADAAGKIVWYRDDPIGRRLKGEYFSASTLVGKGDNTSILDAVSQGEAAAGLLGGEAAQAGAFRRAGTERRADFKFQRLPNGYVQLGVAASFLRPEARRAADAIRESIGQMARDGTVSSIYYNWYLDPSNESASVFLLSDMRRQNTALLASIAVLGAVLALSVWLGLNLRAETKERNRVAVALGTSEAFLNSLVENLPVHIFRKDRAGRYTFANQLFCERFGRTHDQVVGATVFDFLPAAEAATQQAIDEKIMVSGTGTEVADQPLLTANGESIFVHLIKVPVFDAAGQCIGVQGMFIDVTARKRAEAELAKLHAQMLVTSRQAGMAEVATGVLHNVGNVLNSVNVSATLVADHVRHSKGANVAKLAAMFGEHQADLAAFLTTDPRGRMIPGYLTTLSESLAQEQETLTQELGHLRKNIEHIKDIVAMQQSYAKNSGFIETVALVELVEDALRMNASSLARHDVELVCDFQVRPVVSTDKHKIMQILVNLMRNAKHACDETDRTDKRITVRVVGDARTVRISVSDNGIGIPAANLERVFNHGFTTKKTGHGFGLHSGALAAKELGGSLTVESEGPGHGATFILELPLQTGHT